MAERRIALSGVWCAVVAGVLTLATANPLLATPGDMDCSGVVSMSDVDGFVFALVDPAGYAAAYPGCDITQADMNTDGSENGLDIPGFVQLLLSTPTEPPILTQLAGNTLNGYPYFEYVKAFNEDATVEVAVDPSLYPEIIGQTGDIYIVEAKTPGQWYGDASLVDVSLDGPLTVTFGGSTIQENTFTITGGYELDSAVFQEATGDYTGLGHAYDVVIDFNQNGVLDGGDFIDGYGREAGLYIVHDTTQQGPLAVVDVPSYSVGSIFGIPSSYTAEVMYYPANIASMDPLPLIVIGHGNGHDYRWYSHIGHHMASYGYIVISHQNCGGPPDCTLGHTDAVLELQDTIAGGAVNGKIDASRIIWIGHSRGGEGVTRAIDAVVEGTYTPTHYSRESIVLISAMLPIVNDSVDMYDVNFHLWTAAGDSDVSGAAGWDLVDTFELHDRAEKYRMSTVVQGAGHGWFHDGSGDPWVTGPCQIGEENTHLIQLGLFLPLIKHFAEGNIPATDFFWRQYERFHPISVDVSNPCIVVTNEYRNGSDMGNFFIDDYQSEPSLNVSSSGGAVTYSVQNVTEGLLHDNNTSFSWTASDPFNGATQAAAFDDTRGIVFDWNNVNSYYEWEVVPEAGDFSSYTYLSFRGAQGTQHPYTLAVMGDTTFAVTLRDTAGVTSSINIGVFGGGLEQPYARSGGWHNEMEVNRIRPTDFLANNSGLDLTQIAAVRFDFGPAWGSPQGRIVLDELMLTRDYPPNFEALTIAAVPPVPEFFSPVTPTQVSVEISEGMDTVLTGTAMVHYRYDGGEWQEMPLNRLSPVSTIYQASLPAPSCGDTPEFYFSAQGDATGMVVDPPGGASNPYVAYVGTYVQIMMDDFNTDQGWTVENDPSLADGAWERAVPGIDVDRGAPPTDFDGSGYCYVTDNDDNDDVDSGPTYLISPLLDMSSASDPVLRYARWWANDDQDGDPLVVQVSNDDGLTWHTIEIASNEAPLWIERAFYLTDYVTPLTDQMRIRFSAADVPNNSVDEGAIDAVEVFDVPCE